MSECERESRCESESEREQVRERERKRAGARERERERAGAGSWEELAYVHPTTNRVTICTFVLVTQVVN